MIKTTNTGNIISGKVAWKSPSNIALVKYWGKHGRQLPRNPSLSITLRESVTTTDVQFDYDLQKDGPSLDFYFENEAAPAFGDRMLKYLHQQTDIYPFLKNTHLTINSGNTFPHSSGIASSASAFSSLAMCIKSMQEIITEKKIAKTDFLRDASELARLGSGSASRSVYGGYVVWGASDEFEAYSDRYAVPVVTEINPVFTDFQDAILIVSGEKKKVGSSAGHALMDNHPFAMARYEQANNNLTALHAVLAIGDMEQFVDIVENEALSLHAMMMASNPGYLLMEYNTIQIIERIRAFRKEKNIPVCFTLDAGPNVHLLYPNSFKTEVVEWIQNELLLFCIDDRWIDDGMGQGPERLK